ncbi:universal stress protein [Streptomyces anandii]|uniref:universal stress protein n=1 Tax=Streptomyces anandii TaxID=285454 RepID=UPI0036F5575E
MLPPVVAGTDGSVEGLAAAEWAAHEAVRRERALRLVYVWDWNPRQGTGANAAQRHQAGRALRRAAGARRVPGADPVRGPGRGPTGLDAVLRPWHERYRDVRVLVTAVHDRPGPALVGAARGAGLLVVGHRLTDRPGPPCTGPVTHAVIHHATCPVAVVPHF